MGEKVLETDEILKGSKSTAEAGEKGSIYGEPKRQKLKLLVAELPTLVDSLTQDCREYESSLIHESFRRVKMERLCESREMEKKELLKRKLELKCELEAKKMRIEELTTKLEENVKEIDGLQDLNQQLVTKERLCNNELQNARKPSNPKSKYFILLTTHEVQAQIDHALSRIIQAKADITYCENLVANYKSQLER